MSSKKDKQGLKIIIVGAGNVGSTLVEQLAHEGHDITIIDIVARKIQAITDNYDVMGIIGNGASYSVLMEAGIEQADLMIAVTEADELNLLCCTVAKRVGRCAAIARVRMPDYSKEVQYLQEQLGLALVINPEMETAKEAARILAMPTALEVMSFAHGQAEMIKLAIPEGNGLAGMTIAEMAKKLPVSALVCAVERKGEVFIPSGSFCLESGDTLSFAAPRRNIRVFMDTFGFKSRRVRDTLIVGGSKASYYLAQELLHAGIAVKIIEQNRSRCEELSVLLPKAVIINGDGTDEALLKEEGIERADSFVPLTGIDEVNIILTLYAKKISDAKVITKINRMNFKSVVNSLELGSVIYPRYITAEAIVAYVRARSESRNNSIETLYHLFDHRVEAIEFVVDESSEVTGRPLMEMRQQMKKELLIAFINRNGHIIIPGGSDTIEVGDTVTIVTKHTGLQKLTDILN
ncbi:MAG: Trk system potassium transporter TrkA [Lachnospiraceae bacterium]|nr:Trk system potassium transporter TrkA [Lachnospiraceae bacterium]